MNTNIEVQTKPNLIPDETEFLKSCSHAWDRIASAAPSDSSVRLFIDYKGKEFLVGVALASSELMFTLESSARSPFMALEQTLNLSLDKVMKWSTSRKTAVA